MTFHSTDLPAFGRQFDRRRFLTGIIRATSLLSAHRTLALENAAQRTAAGCLSAFSSDTEARCYFSPTPRLRSLEDAVPNRLTRRNFQQTTAYLLDIGEKAVGFRPKIEIYDEPFPGPPNACAAYDFQSSGRSGRILIGYRLLGNILFEANSTLLYAGIVLHELGHLYQIRSGICGGLVCKDRVIGAELHADFIAGVLLSRSTAPIPSASAKALAEGWKDMGDKAGAFNQCDAHGTGEQRLFSLEQGFRAGANDQNDFSELANAGARAIMARNPCSSFSCT